MTAGGSMTDEQRAYWQAYVDEVKPIFRLWQWRIDVSTDRAHDDADATTWISNDYQTACLYLCDGWDMKSRDSQRETIAHELVHVHLSRLSMFAEKIANQLGGQAEGLADEMVGHFLESATEELARVIAPFLPLPPKVKKAKAA
jgi:Zn-dependent peptidase ImmA (M78 family)